MKSSFPQYLGAFLSRVLPARAVMLAAALAAPWLLESNAWAGTVTWTGGGDGMTWNSAANWGGAIPWASDNTVIPALAGNPTVKINTAASVRSLTCDLPLNLSGDRPPLAAPICSQ